MRTGCQFLCDPHLRHSFERSQQEPDQFSETEHFASIASPRMRLFDLGAHFGLYALIAASKGASVVAVEPSSLALSVLRRNIEMNKFREKITVVPCAAGAAEGEIGLVTSGPYGEGFMMASNDHRELTNIPAVTIDGLCHKFGPPTHVKIDVEGYEEEVLRGAAETLREYSPVVLLELHNARIKELGRDSRAVLALLTDSGYTCWRAYDEKLREEQLLSNWLIHFEATKEHTT